MPGSRSRAGSQFTYVIASVITVVWAVSFCADLILPNYDPSPFLHAIMMAVAGWAFGFGIKSNGGLGNGSNGKKE